MATPGAGPDPTTATPRPRSCARKGRSAVACASTEAPPRSVPASAPAPVIPMERPSDPQVVARIRELEERLDRMLDEHAREHVAVEADGAARPARSEPPPPMSSRPPEPEGVLDSAKELLSTDFYLRKWGGWGSATGQKTSTSSATTPSTSRRCSPSSTSFTRSTSASRCTASSDSPPRGAACSSRTTRARCRSTA